MTNTKKNPSLCKDLQRHETGQQATDLRYGTCAWLPGLTSGRVQPAGCNEYFMITNLDVICHGMDIAAVT